MPFNVANAFVDGQVDTNVINPSPDSFRLFEKRQAYGQAFGRAALRLINKADGRHQQQLGSAIKSAEPMDQNYNLDHPSTIKTTNVEPTINESFLDFDVAQDADHNLISRNYFRNIKSSFLVNDETATNFQEMISQNATRDMSTLHKPESEIGNQIALNSTVTQLISDENNNIYNYNNDLMRYFDENAEDFRGRSFSSHAEVWIVKSWQEILLRASFIIPIVLLGIVGNSTIIYSILKFKRFRTKPTNLFILNMAIADLLTTIICPTVALFTDIYQYYVLGSFFCRIEGFSKIAYLLVSSYSLIVLSVDWLLSVVRPFRTRISIRQSWCALVLIWFLSILMASPMLHWRSLRKRQWDDVLEVWCKDAFDESKYYWVGMQFFLIYLPTLIMTIVLIIILAHMDRFEARMRRTRANSMQCIHDDATSGSGSNSVSMRYKRRIVKILFFYLLTSAICWTPLQFTILYRFYRVPGKLQSWFIELNFFAQLCASLSSAMNPIIFGFLSQSFRQIVTKSWIFKLLNRFWPMNKNMHVGNNKNFNNFPMNQLKHLGNNYTNNQNNRNSKLRSHSQRTTRDNTLEQPKLTIGSLDTIINRQTTNGNNSNGPTYSKATMKLTSLAVNNISDSQPYDRQLEQNHHQHTNTVHNGQSSSYDLQNVEGAQSDLTKFAIKSTKHNRQQDKHVSFGIAIKMDSTRTIEQQSDSHPTRCADKSLDHENKAYEFDNHENSFEAVSGNFNIDRHIVEIQTENLPNNEYEIGATIRREISA